MFTFLKHSNYTLYIFICICSIILISILIYSIIKFHNNKKNNSESFLKNHKYTSNKCELITRDFEKDELYHKVKSLDIVYMWVDGSDKNWQFQMKSSNHSRNRNNDELIYSIRSIYKFMPWHEGRIFIVTPNQIPTKLNTITGKDILQHTQPYLNNNMVTDNYNKNVIIIDQKSIMPSEIGNVSNSFLIEIFLHNIPTLTEDFIYMNDDYFIGHQLIPEDFYTLDSNNELRPKFYSNKHIIKGGFKEAKKFHTTRRKVWLSSTYYTNGILDEYFKNLPKNKMNEDYTSPPRYYLEHAPYMFKKSWCKEVYNIWKNDFKKMYKHNNRHWEDIIFVLLYRYYCIESGKSCDLVNESDNIYLKLITNNDDGNIKFYHKVEDGCPKFFTLNDEYSKDEIMIEMSNFLEDFYSEPSPYEKIY